jgi:archaellum component FlaC
MLMKKYKKEHQEYNHSSKIYSIEEVLKRMENKLDKIDTGLTNLEVGQAKLTEKVEGMDNRLKAVEGTQKNQVWALIVLLAGAIATAGARSFFAANP